MEAASPISTPFLENKNPEKMEYIEEFTINKKIKDYKIQLGIKEPGQNEMIIKVTPIIHEAFYYFHKR